MLNALKATIRTLALLTIGAASMAIALYEQPAQTSVKVPYQIVKAMR